MTNRHRIVHSKLEAVAPVLLESHRLCAQQVQEICEKTNPVDDRFSARRAGCNSVTDRVFNRSWLDGRDRGPFLAIHDRRLRMRA